MKPPKISVPVDFIMAPLDDLAQAIQTVMTPDLLKPKYRHSTAPLAGHCYVTTQTYFHLMGGKEAGYEVYHIQMGDDIHWFLLKLPNEIIDLTASQFERPVPYPEGVHGGFLTNYPDERAQIVIERLREQYPELGI
jgi:hypothetical protein